MSTSASNNCGTDCNITHIAVNGHTKDSKQNESHGKPKAEARVPVLLQWKDREMADDLSKLMMAGSATPRKADTDGGDVEMEDR